MVVNRKYHMCLSKKNQGCISTSTSTFYINSKADYFYHHWFCESRNTSWRIFGIHLGVCLRTEDGYAIRLIYAYRNKFATKSQGSELYFIPTSIVSTRVKSNHSSNRKNSNSPSHTTCRTTSSPEVNTRLFPGHGSSRAKREPTYSKGFMKNL